MTSNKEAFSAHKQGTLTGASRVSAPSNVRADKEHDRIPGNDRFELAARGSGFGIFDWDILADQVYYCSRFKELLGYDGRQFQGVMSFFEQALHPDDRDAVINAVNEHLHRGSPWDMECRLRCDDQTYRWFRVCGQAVWDDDMRPVRLVGSMQNIGHRKNFEEALRDSEHKFRDLFEKANDAIFVQSESDQIMKVNHHACELLGYSRNELLSKNLKDLIALENRLPGDSLIKAQWEKWGECPFQIFLRHSDGSLIPAEVTNSELGENMYLSVVRDISERKNVEEILHNQLREEQAILDSVPAMIWYKDRDNRIIRLNKLAAQACGRTVPDAEGCISHELWPGNVEESRRLELEVMESGMPSSGVVEQFRTSSDNLRWVQVDRVPQRDVRGNVMGVIVLAIDVTDRMAAEEKARRRESEFAHIARLSTLGEMATGLAHEINQPLFAISNYAEACLQRLNTGDIDKTSLSHVLAQIGDLSQRAGEIIRRLRHLVSKRPPRRSTLSINNEIESVLALLHNEIRHSQVSVTLELAPSLPPVVADSVQIQQVILNLLRNGLEAMEDSNAADRKLMIKSSHIPNTCVVVEIADSGRVLAAEQIDHLFEPFYTTKANGLGMGLSISRSIIESHGGRLSALPNVGRGLTCSFTLPLQNREVQNVL